MLGARTVSEDIDFAGSSMPVDHPVGAAPVWSRQHNDVALTSALTIAAHDKLMAYAQFIRART